MEGGDEETLEETAPPTPRAVRPAPKPGPKVEPNGTRVGDFIAYLTNHGQGTLAKSLTVADKRYIAEQDFDAEDFAACAVATAEGSWDGADDWIKRRPGVRSLHQHRYAQWVMRHAPVKAGANGPVKRGVAALADL